MKNRTMMRDSLILIVIGGLVLFSTNYFLPDDVAFEIASFTGGGIGYVIYIRTSSWNYDEQYLKILHMLGITFLMSTWASLFLLVTCGVSSKLTICTENQLNGFVILNFFFPLLIVLLGWLSNNLPRPK